MKIATKMGENRKYQLTCKIITIQLINRFEMNISVCELLEMNNYYLKENQITSKLKLTNKWFFGWDGRMIFMTTSNNNNKKITVSMKRIVNYILIELEPFRRCV